MRMSVKREWCIAKNARSIKSNFLWNVCVHAYVSHLKSTGHVWWLNHPVIQMMTTVSNYFYTALIIIWFHFFRNRVLFYLLSVSVSLNLISKKYKCETYVLFLNKTSVGIVSVFRRKILINVVYTSETLNCFELWAVVIYSLFFFFTHWLNCKCKWCRYIRTIYYSLALWIKLFVCI